jgi:hypothetical protein
MEYLDAVSLLVEDGRLLVAGKLAEKLEAFLEGRGQDCPVWRAYREPRVVAMITQLKTRVAECKKSFRDLESVRDLQPLIVR